MFAALINSTSWEHSKNTLLNFFFLISTEKKSVDNTFGRYVSRGVVCPERCFLKL